MGLITREVEIVLGGTNIKCFEDLGYIIPRRIDKKGRNAVPIGTKIIVKVEHLSSSSHSCIDAKCDECGDTTKNIMWRDFNISLKNGKYYCHRCAGNGYKKWISFEEWCIKNNRLDISSRWDYSLNKLKPSDITYCTNVKFWFKCPMGIHNSELKNISGFVSGQEGSMRCNACHSFAQYLLNKFGEDGIKDYWDFSKNTISPWKIDYSSGKKFYIYCQEKSYHGSYEITLAHFIGGRRCSYCGNYKVHLLDSLGKILEDMNLLYIWSDKNTKSPYEYNPNTVAMLWWKCIDGKHEDYQKSGNCSFLRDFRCATCVSERDESMLQEKVRLYLNELGYEVLHEQNCTLNPKNIVQHKTTKLRANLRYDNEIILQNNKHLFCEVNGSQHYQLAGFHTKSARKNHSTPEYELLYQQTKDKYKEQYALYKGCSFLTIPYWEDDLEETYKKSIDNKIAEILLQQPNNLSIQEAI